METSVTSQFASEKGRWYDKQGNPVNEVTAKNGRPRPTTIIDARKLNLVPSVTTVLRVAAKPGLDAWKLRQMFEVAHTTPRAEGESDDSFYDRVVTESKERGRLAAERGKDLHGAIEKFIMAQPVPTEWSPHVATVRQTLSQYGIDITTGNAEKTFVSPLGYGGKIDFSTEDLLLDFKSRDRIEERTKLGYDEHIMQLAAYAHGLGIPDARLLNVFVGASDGVVRIREWERPDCERAWGMFQALLAYWKLANKV